jgi:glycosyltransferase involved in cell wall biosynthesis
MTNVAFVLPHGMSLGGVNTWSIEMARQLVLADQPVYLIEHVNREANDQSPTPPNVQLIREFGQKPTHIRAKDIHRYLPSYLKPLPGVMVPNYSPGAYAACATVSRQRPADLRVIGFLHSDEPYYYDLLSHYDPLIHLFVGVSRETADTLNEYVPHRQQDIRLRYYGVNVADVLTRTYTSHPDPIQLVYAGRLVELQKKVSTLIRLTEILGRRQVDFRLQIVGDGEERAHLLETIGRLDAALRNRVILAGRIPHVQMPELWRSADICVLVSEYEGTSIAMLEAMAEGCVPVVTRVSGTKAVIEPGKNGYLVDVGDLAEMARMIQMLAADRGKLAQLGNQAHRTIADNFSLQAYTHWFLSMVDEAWEQSPRPWPTSRALFPPTVRIHGVHVPLPLVQIGRRCAQWWKQMTSLLPHP